MGVVYWKGYNVVMGEVGYFGGGKYVIVIFLIVMVGIICIYDFN